jgi:hypothetical protein
MEITAQTTHTITIPPASGHPAENAYGVGQQSIMLTLTNEQVKELLAVLKILVGG